MILSKTDLVRFQQGGALLAVGSLILLGEHNGAAALAPEGTPVVPRDVLGHRVLSVKILEDEFSINSIQALQHLRVHRISNTYSRCLQKLALQVCRGC